MTVGFDGTLYSINPDIVVAPVQVDGSTKDPAAFNNKLGLEVFHILQVKLTPEEQTYMSKPEVRNAAAFLNALEGFSQPTEQSRKAVQLYEQAVYLDNQFIFPYVGVSSRMQVYDTYSAAKAYLQKAIRQHPDNPFLRLYDGSINQEYKYMKFLMDYPDNLQALYKLAWVYRDNRNYNAHKRMPCYGKTQTNGEIPFTFCFN